MKAEIFPLQAEKLWSILKRQFQFSDERDIKTENYGKNERFRCDTKRKQCLKKNN